MDSRRCPRNTSPSRHSPDASGPRWAIALRARRVAAISIMRLPCRIAIKPHISDDDPAFQHHLAYRTPHDSGIGDRAINQASQVLTYGWVTRMPAGRILLPVVGGNTEYSSHSQRTLEDRLVILDTCYRRDGIPRDFAVVSEIEDPGDT